MIGWMGGWMSVWVWDATVVCGGGWPLVRWRWRGPSSKSLGGGCFVNPIKCIWFETIVWDWGARLWGHLARVSPALSARRAGTSLGAGRAVVSAGVLA